MELNAPVCSTDPDLWFSDERTDRRKAKALCLSCPLMVECREYGKTQEHGIWGGVQARLTRAQEAENKRQHKQERNAEIIALHREGLVPFAIGKRLSISPATASAVINAA